MEMHSTEYNMQESISRQESFKMFVSELHNILNTLPASVLFLKICFYFQLMCTRGSLSVHVHTYADAPGGQKNTLDPLELAHIPDCELSNMCVVN